MHNRRRSRFLFSYPSNVMRKYRYSNKKSIIFDGVDEGVFVDHDSLLMPTDELSISFWFKALVVPPVSYSPWVCKVDDIDWESGYGVYYTDLAGTKRINFYVNKWDVDLVNVVWVADTDWHHVVGVADGTNLNIWLDGIKTAGGAYSKPITESTGSFRMMDGFAPYISSGNLDEVSLWNVGLSDAEVLEIYNGGSPADLGNHSKLPNLVSWWRMGDVGTYPRVMDVASGFDGVMQNMIESDIVEDVP